MTTSFSVFDQAALSTVINRNLTTVQEQEGTLGEQIAPLVPVQSREVKLSVRDVHAFGKGQYRAPGATPALFEPLVSLREEIIELAILSEEHRINDEDYLALNSSDENYRKKAGLSIVDRGNILSIRNRRLTEALRWEAFLGEAVITYPTGSQKVVDYGIPANHNVTVTNSWSNHATSDPIADLKAIQLLSGQAVGHYGLKIHLSSEAWENAIQSDSLIARLTGSDRPMMIPTKEDFLSQLRAGTDIVIYDGGYRDEGTDRSVSNLTPYLPKDKVLVTTNYTIEGERIADMPDGQVIVSTGWNTVDIRQGAQAEVQLDHRSHTHVLRYESARIPRILQPGAFAWLDVEA